MNSSNRLWYCLIIVLLLADLVYSFLQHYSVGLDGDLALIVMPAEWYSHVLKDPFGWSVIVKDAFYVSPNRFFVHWIMGVYFKTVPLWLQHFMGPINSIYITCAIAKLLIQAGMISVLALYIRRLMDKSGVKSFFFAAILVVPLFQSSGYNVMMGIIDKSITYTFFYAGTMLALLVFYFPFSTMDWTGKKNFSYGMHFLLFVLAITLPFSGPLIPGVTLIICFMFIFFFWYFNYRNQGSVFSGGKLYSFVQSLPGQVSFYFSLICFLSIYSLYIGTHNHENFWGETIPILERYQRLPLGVWNLLVTKLGFPLILLMIGINAYLLKRFHLHDPKARRIITVLNLLVVFTIIYILLLPLGGYRSYRPNILRRDTVMPIVLGLFLVYGWSSYYLIEHVLPSIKKFYIAASMLLGLAFTVADNPDFDDNKCERSQLEYLSKAGTKEVWLSKDCVIMTWQNKYDPQNAVVNNQLLQYWGVIDKEKFYFHK